MLIKAEIKAVFNHKEPDEQGRRVLETPNGSIGVSSAVFAKRKFRHNSQLKAIAALVFDDCFIIKSVRLVQGRKGLFVSMPAIRNAYGGYSDICHPLDPDLKAVIDMTVIEAYHSFMSQDKGQPCGEGR